MLILAVQFHEADKPQAMRLARFIADLEPQTRDDITLCFVARFDCAHDEGTVEYCASKFPTRVFTTSTGWTGWPAGPNGMARDLLTLAGKQWRHADGLLMLEPDCVPVARDWLDRLIAGWQTAREAGALMMGAWRESGGEKGHINGNCVLALEVCTPENVAVIDQHVAWDCTFGVKLHAGWWVTELIANWFDSRGATQQVLDSSPHAVLVHGFKDDSMFELAGRNLLMGP